MTSISLISYIFFLPIRVFFHKHWRFTGQHRGSQGTIFVPLYDFHSFTKIKWLSCIFNRTASIYQIATRWDLPPYWITIWMIEDVILIFVYVLDGLILGLCCSNLTRETDGLKLAPTIPLVLQDWPSVLVTPSHVISYGHTLTKTNLVSYRHNI